MSLKMLVYLDMAAPAGIEADALLAAMERVAVARHRENILNEVRGLEGEKNTMWE